MKVSNVVVGQLETNCYIIDINNHVLVIDPGDEYDKIMCEIGSRKIDAIIITHRHFDHIGALNSFKNIPVYDNKNIKEINDIYDFEVINTTGHTNDSITLYFQKDKVMFTGDFLFYRTIGRTDLKTGSNTEMINSLELIRKYPDDITIYPGHGPKTNLGFEKKHNMYMK